MNELRQYSLELTYSGIAKVKEKANGKLCVLALVNVAIDPKGIEEDNDVLLLI